MCHITFFRFEKVKFTLKLLLKPEITHQTSYHFQALPFMRWKICCYVTMPIHLCAVITTVTLEIASAK